MYLVDTNRERCKVNSIPSPQDGRGFLQNKASEIEFNRPQFTATAGLGVASKL